MNHRTLLALSLLLLVSADKPTKDWPKKKAESETIAGGLRVQPAPKLTNETAPADVGWYAANRDQMNKHLYHVNMAKTFDPATISRVIVWIDTGGFACCKDYCDPLDPDAKEACPDGVAFGDVRRNFLFEQSYKTYPSQIFESALTVQDEGEWMQFVEGNADFEKAKEEIKDGKFDVPVSPSKDAEYYHLNSVMVSVEFKPIQKK